MRKSTLIFCFASVLLEKNIVVKKSQALSVDLTSFPILVRSHIKKSGMNIVNERNRAESNYGSCRCVF